MAALHRRIALVTLAHAIACTRAANNPAPVTERPELPELPDGMPALQPSYDAVKASHAEPLLLLAAPWATNAEHTRWVEGELEPWRERRLALMSALADAKPQFPPDDAPDAAWLTAEAELVVFRGLMATVQTDIAMTWLRIPVPREALDTPAMRDDARRSLQAMGADAKKSAVFWLDTCRQDDDDDAEPIPAVTQWRDYCATLSRTLDEWDLAFDP
jgi:hypothetical protein